MELRARVELAEADVVERRASLAKELAEAERKVRASRNPGKVVLALGFVAGMIAGAVLAVTPRLPAPPVSPPAPNACRDELMTYRGAHVACIQEQVELGIVCRCPEGVASCGCGP